MLNRILVFGFCILLFGCTNYDDLNDLGKEEQDVEIAIPVINSRISIADITEGSSSDNFSIRIDEDERVTLVYQGEVVRQDKNCLLYTSPSPRD